MYKINKKVHDWLKQGRTGTKGARFIEKAQYCQKGARLTKTARLRQKVQDSLKKAHSWPKK